MIIYSFSLYLLTCYLLVILPLPDSSTVSGSYMDKINLVPFSFVADFFNENPFRLSQPSTYLLGLKHSTFLVPAFNVLMLVPFGSYLRYFFKCSFKKVVLYTFLLSLFFELTQLSGLYFIYNAPYRLFDMDDLIQNTAGGMVGYFVASLFTRIMPTRDLIDSESFEKGKKVSGIRFILAYAIDIQIIGLISSFSMLPWLFLLIYLGYFTLLPKKKGSTLGMKLLKFKMSIPKKDHNLLYVVRSVMMLLYFYGIPYSSLWTIEIINGNGGTIVESAAAFVCFMVFMIYIIVTIYTIFAYRKFVFDKICNVSYISEVKSG
ncbi:VanZ family protein [Facklamia miroungae]|nr:VanZ family protein [Facklamia miroungae]